MRESIGATSIFALCITFIMLFTAYLAISVNYSKAFRIKSNIVSMIEENGRYDGDVQKEIENYIIAQAYTASGKCPESNSLTDNNSDTVGNWGSATQINYTNPSSDTSNVCIYRLEIKTNNDDIDANKVYYKVVTFFKFDLPIIGNITTFKIAGDTKLLYE